MGFSLGSAATSPSSATARPHSALCSQAKFSIVADQPFNWTLDRLICSFPSVPPRSSQGGKSSVAEHLAKLKPSKPAAQMFVLTRLTDG